MRDLSIAVMLLGLAGLAWQRPWLGVLALVFVATVRPDAQATAFMQGFPAYAALFGLVTLAAVWDQIRRREWPRPPWDWRLLVVALLCSHFVVTTAFGLNPAAGWPRLAEVLKRLPLMLLIVLLIDTQDKLRWLLWTLGLSIGVLFLKGGFWAFTTGFQDRVYGPPGSQYADNNHFAVATTMAIPLLALWFQQTRDRWLRVALGALILLGFASALSSWSRGGLLGASMVAVLLVWHSPRKAVLLSLFGAGVAVAFFGLPDAWFDRMHTLADPAAEGSAATRLELWRAGWSVALDHPWLGRGFGSWIYLSLPVDGSPRVWHSAYVDLVVEQGFVGLGLWAALVVGSVWSLTRMINGGRPPSSLAGTAAMLRASLAAYLVGAAFLSIAYWELLFIVLGCAIVLSRLADEPRVETGRSDTR